MVDTSYRDTEMAPIVLEAAKNCGIDSTEAQQHVNHLGKQFIHNASRLNLIKDSEWTSKYGVPQKLVKEIKAVMGKEAATSNYWLIPSRNNKLTKNVSGQGKFAVAGVSGIRNIQGGKYKMPKGADVDWENYQLNEDMSMFSFRKEESRV